MKLEYRIVDKMIMEGTLKIRDFKKILESKMYPIEMIYFSVFSARIPKYIIAFAAYYGYSYKESINEYLDSSECNSKTILDIYDVYQGFYILNYRDKIEKGTTDDIYRFILILLRDYPEDTVKNLISYLFETYPEVKDKYNFNLFIMSLKTKTLKEFLDILIKNSLLEYTIKYKDIMSFNDLKDIYYLLKVIDIKDMDIIKERLRNKILNFVNNSDINQEMLNDIEKISEEIGLGEFVFIFSNLQVMSQIKNKIMKCLAEYFFSSQELLEKNYDALENVNVKDNLETSDDTLDIKANIFRVPNKVYRKLYKTVDNKKEKNYN